MLDGKTTSPVVLAPGDVYVNADFGYQPDYGYGNSIGDSVWLDTNADGLRNPGESGIPGVEVKITWYGDDGILGNADDVVYLTTTDAIGEYRVDGLPDGNFQVTTNTSGNLAVGGPLGGLNQTYDATSSTTDHTSTVTGLGVGVDAPVAALDQDFGYSPNDPAGSNTGVIGDTIFVDANGNGAPDPGEGIPGVKVTVSDGVNPPVVTYTDANGNWYVGELPDGTYTVTVDPTTLPERRVRLNEHHRPGRRYGQPIDRRAERGHACEPGARLRLHRHGSADKQHRRHGLAGRGPQRRTGQQRTGHSGRAWCN